MDDRDGLGGGSSWVNAVTAWLDRLPGPTWAAYAVAMALGVAIGFIPMLDPAFVGSEGPSTSFAAAYYGVLPFAVLGLIHGLDRTASTALARLRPVLAMGDHDVEVVHRRLTVIPARPAAVLGFVGLLVTALSLAADPVSSGIVGYAPLTVAFRWAWEGMVASIFLILIYHTIRQLGIIGGLHRKVERVDIFVPGPLYAMSRVTAGTAIGVVLLLAPSLLLLPREAGTGYLIVTAAWYSVTAGFAAAAFFLPLRGVHDLLSLEKSRLQAEVGRRLAATLETLHRAVDTGDAAGIATGASAIEALVAERQLVARLSTWPWSVGALTGFLSAVLLPIGVWLVTRFLERVV